MDITYLKIVSLFAKYNADYFDSKLPFPEFKIMHSYRALGRYTSYPVDGGHYGDVMEFSDNYDYTEAQLRDVVVHEMIHMYLMHFGIDRKCSHGKEFKSMMDDLNIRYGLGIRVICNPSKYKLKKGKSKFMKTICTML